MQLYSPLVVRFPKYPPPNLFSLGFQQRFGHSGNLRVIARQFPACQPGHAQVLFQGHFADHRAIGAHRFFHGLFVLLRDFREGGLVRSSSFDRGNDRIIGKIGKSNAAVIQKAAELGGTVIPGKAGSTIRFSFLPNFPTVLNLWLEDEDFPASGKVLLDAATDSALRVEAAGILLAMLEEKLQQ